MNILLLGSVFFGYVDRVRKELSNLGHNIRVFYGFNPNYFQRIQSKMMSLDDKKEKYYSSFLSSINGDEFDAIIVMGGRELTLDFLSSLKNRCNNSRFVLYLSADLKSYNYPFGFLIFFDRIFSYSLLDSRSNNFIYLPWFFTEFKLSQKKIDISFIGSFHSVRLPFLLQIKNLDKHLKVCSYIYTDFLSSLKSFREFFGLQNSIHFHGMPYSSYIQLLSESMATLDLPEKGQENITTRPIEALGTKTKIITTNHNICNYDFYSKENIAIIDDPREILDLKLWLKVPYKQINQDVVSSYYIRNWVKRILHD